jgi:UDP-2-acetamido-3-amino-2,3-dideoxy-glucuronate N-acetyltransferase
MVVKMKKIKIAVAGCGHWGKNLVRNFSELGNLAFICDDNKECGATMSQQYNVPYITFEEALKSDIDGIVIATPAATHYELTKRALQAVKHVFVEKPMSLKIEEAQHLCQISDDSDRILMVGHLMQYHPAFIELKHLLSKGTLGRLQYINSNRLNLGKFRNEENILWSFAPHDISMILGLVEDVPESVYASGVCHLNPRIHDVTTTYLSFKSGVQAHIFVSWLHPYKEQKLVVVGDRGMAVFDDGLPWGEKLKLYPHQVNWVKGLPEPSKADAVSIPLEVSEPLKIECQHFIDCIANKQTPRTNGHEGMRVLQVLSAAQQSLQNSMSITIANELQPYYKHETAIVDQGCEIGKGTKVWHFSHILSGSKIGEDCVIGQNVMIGPDVVIGDKCKIQNNVSLYKGITLEDGVFCGPSCVFTNVYNPRSEVDRKDEFRNTYVERGVTIGANATIVCGYRLGAYSFIGAGAVVTKDVKPHALVVGNPAKQIGWVSHAGEKLGEDLICPRNGTPYRLLDTGELEEIFVDVAPLKTA